MTEIPLPLYYEGQSVQDMVRLLRQQYLRSSGWLDSARSKLSERDGEPIPWFTYAAIDFLERELSGREAVFEYGGGQSTLWWAKRTRRVAAVDHDPAFGALITPQLPANATFRVVPENDSLPPDLQRFVPELPPLVDPERTVQTYRGGQLNQAFLHYALSVLAEPRGTFDIVVVDGMARTPSTWAAIRHFTGRGFIVFDNADRDTYAPAYCMLADAGYRRIDFSGLGAVNPYGWTTAIFYQPAGFPGVRWFADERTAPPADETGVLVLGYNRPLHLQSVLESLRLQGRIGAAHVWIDGTQGRAEHDDANAESLRIARRYAVAELREVRGHLGIEKMMLDALADMTTRYARVVVLEDDCFPTDRAIATFEAELAAAGPEVFSIYGHHFGVEPSDTRDFPRFQGWGWAARSEAIRAVLPELRRLFLLDEAAYAAEIERRLTPAVAARLEVTPGRDVVKVLRRFFSWDSALALLTAERGLAHRRTPTPVVANTGIVAGTGHFTHDAPRFRAPPFAMITLGEAWRRFDTVTSPCDGTARSYGLDRLDHLILDAIGEEPGFFIEIGANDGVTQNNSVLLETRGWRGMLIEATPAAFAKCVRTRPAAIVEHAACVADASAGGTVTVTDVGLMSSTALGTMTGDARETWLARGEGFAGRARQEVEVPRATLSGLLDKHGIARVDLLILDVEGGELEVLKGLDLSRHAPAIIVAEDAYDERVAGYLTVRGFRLERTLLERKFTRDRLYRRE